MPDVLGFLLGIIVIATSATVCIIRAIDRHHEREMTAHRLTQEAQNQRYLIMNTLIEQKALPANTLDELLRRQR